MVIYIYRACTLRCWGLSVRLWWWHTDWYAIYYTHTKYPNIDLDTGMSRQID